MHIEIDTAKLDTLARKRKAIEAEICIDRVLNSDIFKNNFIKALNTKMYKNGETSRYRDFSPEAIFLYFYSKTMLIEIDDYYTFKKVIGYTMKHIKTIFVNTKYFDKRSTILCSSNIVHEWGHKLGFGHDRFNTSRRKNSLCYLLNAVFQESAREIYGHLPKKKYVCKKYFFFFKKCKWVNT